MFREFRPAYDLRGFAPLGGLFVAAIVGFIFAPGYWNIWSVVAVVSGSFVAIRAAAYYRLQTRPELVLDDAKFRFRKAAIEWRLIKQFIVVQSPSSTAGAPFIGVVPNNIDLLLSQAPQPVRALWLQAHRLTGAPILIPPVKGLSPEELCELLESYRVRGVIGAGKDDAR